MAFGPVINSPANAVSAPKVGGSLNWVNGTFTAPSFDPALATTGSSEIPYMLLVYASLFDITRKGVIIPDLATGYAVSRNGLAFTIELRRGVRFQDGTPFNAAAVRFNFERFLNPSLGCICRPFLSNVTSITTPKPYTVVLHLNTPDAALPSVLATSFAGMMASPTAVTNEGSGFGSAPVGAGPYKLVNFVPSALASFQRWTGYWDSRHTYLNTITINGAAQTTVVPALEAGTAQMGSSADPVSVAQAAKIPSIQLETTPLQFYQFVYFNEHAPPFNNLLAREAVAYATNNELYVKDYLYDQGIAAQTLIAPGQTAYFGNKLPGFPKYNLAKAQALVKQLGGLSFTELPFVGTQSTAAQQADVLQSMWDAAGMNVTIALNSEPTNVKNDLSADFQVLIFGYGEYQDPALSLSTIMSCGGGLNGGYCDPIVNSELAQAQQTLDVARRKVLYERVMKQAIATDFAYVPISYNATYYLLEKNVHGFIPAGFVTVYLKSVWLS